MAAELQEVEAELDAARTRTQVNEAAKKLQFDGGSEDFEDSGDDVEPDDWEPDQQPAVCG